MSVFVKLFILLALPLFTVPAHADQSSRVPAAGNISRVNNILETYHGFSISPNGEVKVPDYYKIKKNGDSFEAAEDPKETSRPTVIKKNSNEFLYADRMSSGSQLYAEHFQNDVKSLTHCGQFHVAMNLDGFCYTISKDICKEVKESIAPKDQYDSMTDKKVKAIASECSYIDTRLMELQNSKSYSGFQKLAKSQMGEIRKTVGRDLDVTPNFFLVDEKRSNSVSRIGQAFKILEACGQMGFYDKKSALPASATSKATK